MFVTNLRIAPHTLPLTLGYAERLGLLARGSRHVAYFYPHPDTSTFRYRVLNMIEALTVTDATIGASWFSAEDLPHACAILDRADVVVICRAPYSEGFARLIGAARARGRRILFDIDDLVFDDRFVHLILETLDLPVEEQTWDAWFGSIARIGATMRLCDGTILTNAFLAERAQAYCGLPTAVIPNFLNGAQIDASAAIFEAKRSLSFARDGRIHIGYFSGSPTHQRDFAIAADALVRLMKRDPRIILRVVGWLDLGGWLADHPDRVEVFPFQDIVSLQRLVGEVEINLAPLQDNVFTNCKSELKVFEASVVGTLTVASPTFTLRHAIRDGETGFLAPSHRWETVLARAIERFNDYPAIASAAAAMALERYSPERQGRAIIEALFGDEVRNEPVPACRREPAIQTNK